MTVGLQDRVHLLRQAVHLVQYSACITHLYYLDLPTITGRCNPLGLKLDARRCAWALPDATYPPELEDAPSEDAELPRE
eukprot:SAG31_NODE_16906_length_690_cov_3.280880_1_plen_78_part_10